MPVDKNTDFEYDIKAVFDKYYEALCLFASRFLSQHDDAEDVVQGIFVNLIEKPPALRSDQHLQHYLYISVRNSCLSHIRHLGAKNRYLSTMDEDEFHVVEGEIIATEVYRRLATSLDLLPTECRKVFELCYIQGYDNEAAANVLNISVNTVKAQKARGKKILREKLKDMFALFALLYGIEGML